MDSIAVIPSILVSLACLATIGVTLKIQRRFYPRSPYPPGPRADFIIGHARVFPTEFPWFTFAEWGKKWGEGFSSELCFSFLNFLSGGLIYARILYKPVIIINDLEIARDLLEKRGSKYSDRPCQVLFSEMSDSILLRSVLCIFIRVSLILGSAGIKSWYSCHTAIDSVGNEE